MIAARVSCRSVEIEEGQVRLIRGSSQAGKRDLARTQRWVTAWLIAGAALALLLLANSIRDYLFVWRLLAVQQVRRRAERAGGGSRAEAPTFADTGCRRRSSS